MESAAALMLTSALATAELCPAPLDTGTGEPQLCRVANAQRIETPYFSIHVEADQYVGIDRDGRRLRVQPTLARDHAYLQIEAIESIDLPNWPDCRKVTTTTEEMVTWHDCHAVVHGMFERRLAARLRDQHVLIAYRYSAPATPLAPSLERMTQSVRILAR